MSTFALTNPEVPSASASTPADDFSILEQRVLRAVELLKTEREARAIAEGNASTLQQLLDEQSEQLAEAEARIKTLEIA